MVAKTGLKWFNHLVCTESTLYSCAAVSFESLGMCFGNGKAILGTEFIKYLGIMISTNLRWSSYSFDWIKILPRLSFHTHRLRQFGTRLTVILSLTMDSSCPTRLISCNLSRPHSEGFLRSSPSIVFHEPVFLRFWLTQLSYDLHIVAWEKISTEIFADLTHPLHGDLSSCRLHSSTCSTLRLILLAC